MIPDRQLWRGNRRDANRLQAPPLPPAGQQLLPRRPGVRLHNRRLIARINGSSRHPGDKIIDNRSVELRTLLRHLDVSVFVGDRLDEQTFAWIIGNHGWAGLAPFAQTVPKIDAETAL